MNKIAVYLSESRPNFLILAVACALIGVSAAYWKSGSINLLYMTIAVIGAISAHAAVNILNEYSDYKSGLESLTIKTPYNGGTGNMTKNLISSKVVLFGGLFALTITIAIGLFFTYKVGYGLLLVGIPGILIITLYTDYITRFPLPCLLAPGLAFGPCMVLGTYFVLQGHYDYTALIASLAPFFLVNNLLLLNQFPDREPDRVVGRRHLLIVSTPKKSAYVYASFKIAAYLSLIVGVYLRLLPAATLIGLLSLPLTIVTIKGVLKNCDDVAGIVPFLGKNVAIILSTLFLIVLGFFISSLH